MPSKQVWSNDPSLTLKGMDVIKKWHPDLQGHVRFIFCLEAEVLRGTTCMGTARKVGGFASAFFMADPSVEVYQAEPFFLITIHKATYERLTPKQQIALLDHELAHCKVEPGDEGPKLTTVGHDLEEFYEIVKRHGHWLPRVKEFVDNANSGQYSLVEEGLADMVGSEEPAEPESSDEDGMMEVVKFLVEKGQASTSMLQRKFDWGFKRAADMLNLLERAGVVGECDGPRPREVLIDKDDIGFSALRAKHLSEAGGSE